MKKPKAPRLLTVLIVTTITIVFWIFFGVYTILTTKGQVNVPPELMEPITPTLNTEALEELTKRIFFEEGAVPPPPITVDVSPTPTVEEASPTPTLELVPEDTEALEVTPTATQSPTPQSQ